MAVKVSNGEVEIIWTGASGIAYGGEDYFAGDIFTVDAATAARAIRESLAREATTEDKAAIAKKGGKK